MGCWELWPLQAASMKSPWIVCGVRALLVQLYTLCCLTLAKLGPPPNNTILIKNQDPEKGPRNFGNSSVLLGQIQNLQKPVLCFQLLSLHKYVRARMPNGRPPKGSKKSTPPPNMNPLLHWRNLGIIRGFHFLDPLGCLGNGRLHQNKVVGPALNS